MASERETGHTLMSLLRPISSTHLALRTGDQRLSYYQLIEDVDALAGILRSIVPPGACAGICTGRPADLVRMVFALNACRASVFLAHPQTPPSEFAAMAHAEAACLVVTDVPWHDSSWTPLTLPTLHSRFDTVLSWCPPVAEPRASVAAIHLYTSGTEGAAKSVVRGEAGLISEMELLARTLCMPEGATVLCPVPLTSSYGFTVGLLHTLSRGGTLLCERPVSGRQLFNVAKAHKPWMLVGNPNLYDLWARGLSSAPVIDDEALSHCVSAGSPLPRTVRERFEDLWGRSVMRHYGATECGVISWELTRSDNPFSVGHLLEGVHLTIDPPDALEGEVVIKTPHGALGYVDGSCLCRATLAGLPGGIRTGDLGRLTCNGELLIVGRLKEQISVHGLKVDPVEIEALIANHRQVKDVAVVGINIPGGDQWVAACIVCPSDVTDMAIAQTYIGFIPPYKHPRRIVRLNDIPRTPSGKIKRLQLAKIVMDQVSTAATEQKI